MATKVNGKDVLINNLIKQLVNLSSNEVFTNGTTKLIKVYVSGSKTLFNRVGISNDPTPYIVANGVTYSGKNNVTWDSGKYCSSIDSAIANILD